MIQTLNVTATPVDWTDTDSGIDFNRWESTSHDIQLYQGGQSVTPSLNIFYPETTYQVSSSGVDDFGQPINITQSEDYFITKNDCPAFANLYIGSLQSENGEDYVFTNNLKDIEVVLNTDSSPVEKNWENNKDFLNTPKYCYSSNSSFLQNMHFTASGLIDFTDTNAYDPDQVIRYNNFNIANTSSKSLILTCPLPIFGFPDTGDADASSMDSVLVSVALEVGTL